MLTPFLGLFLTQDGRYRYWPLIHGRGGSPAVQALSDEGCDQKLQEFLHLNGRKLDTSKD
jgi:hypothetical protein